MIKIICDTEEQMFNLQRILAESSECPFNHLIDGNISDYNCYLCVRDNIEWEVRRGDA